MSKVTVAAVGDIHFTRDSSVDFFAGVERKADVLLLAGDLTQYGSILEIGPLVAALKKHVSRIPVVAVLGNHDFGRGEEKLIVEHLQASGVHVLGRESGVTHWHAVIRGVSIGVAGAKGFMGGFGSDRCAKFGEPMTVALIEEAEREAAHLEKGLYRLSYGLEAVPIALMHYAPIQGTVKNERAGIAGWLGSDTLYRACRRGQATVAFHGHAHRGPVRGHREGFAVRNVALPALNEGVLEGSYGLWHLMTYSSGRWSDHSLPKGAS